MLRGLDVSENSGLDDPVVVNAADRTDIGGILTVYLRDSPPAYVRDRQRAVLDVVDRLEAVGLTDGVRVVGWPKHVAAPVDDSASAVVGVYDEFVEAVGRRSLQPFFEEKSGTGRSERVVVFPAICVALRRGETLTGLYPHWEDGTHHSIETCIEALAAGDSLVNLDP